MKVDDPVGAISVHGTNGLWGVISVGLFADGRSNYGGSWNGVTGSVTGLFYGDASQLVAQLIGVATLVGLRVHLQLRGQPGGRCGDGPARVGQGGTGRTGPARNGPGRLSRVRTEGPGGRRCNKMTGRADSQPTPALRACRRFPGETLTRSRRPNWPGTSRALEEACEHEPALGRPAHLPGHGVRHELRCLQIHGRARSWRYNSEPDTFLRAVQVRRAALPAARADSRRARRP